jgi:hypothetical protein
MMARSLNALSTGRIQKRKTNLPQITIFGLQRAAGPYSGPGRLVSGFFKPFGKVLVASRDAKCARVPLDPMTPSLEKQ